MTVPQGFSYAGHQVFLRAILDEPNNRFVMRVCGPELHFDSDHHQANRGDCADQEQRQHENEALIAEPESETEFFHEWNGATSPQRQTRFQ
jgi:hypothetical protein